MQSARLQEKAKVAVVKGVNRAGDSSSVVMGKRVSIDQAWLAPSGSWLPAASVAFTKKVCKPLFRFCTSWGEVQELSSNESKEQEKVHGSSSQVKVKVAVMEAFMAGGLSVMVVVGAFVSKVQVWLAGVASMLPAASVAVMLTLYSPSSSKVGLKGEVQAVASSSLTWQLKVHSLSLQEKVKVVVVLRSAGLVSRVVSGGVVSTVQLYWVAFVW